MFKYVKKAINLGPKKTLLLFKNRSETFLFDHLVRKKALAKKAHSSWQLLQKESNKKKFSDFLNNLKSQRLSCADSLLIGQSDANVVEKADQALHNTFELLGSVKQPFFNIPWHEDFRLKQQKPTSDYSFDKQAYFKDIHVNPGKTENLVKDIKIPWELSRFNHLIFLGKAFSQTNDIKYVDAFINQITDWLEENPYLLGPNWVCPMDVGLRAINWIIAFHFFKNATIDGFFWERFVCSLYDHMRYLENNWEIYDSITSNHYLSDLIGYFYCCWFFSEFEGVSKKTTWCYQEILKEFEKQIFDEGTDYESTTYYHQLVTEIFYHFYLLAPELGFSLPAHFTQKLTCMFQFFDWCTPINGKLIQIGDNDSGKVVMGISKSLIDAMKSGDAQGIQHFQEFGISIFKTDNVHVSLRHHAYQKKQPTAHFHNDAGSITLNISGVDIFVDPGSYVYTASAPWRNQFRSVQAHNTMFLEEEEPILFDERLFALNIAERKLDLEVGILQTSHELYERFGLQTCRKIDVSDNKLLIKDQWKNIGAEKQPSIKMAWNFTLSPSIEPKMEQEGWSFWYKEKQIAFMETTLEFEIIARWYSPAYGQKVATLCLKASRSLDFDIYEIQIKF